MARELWVDTMDGDRVKLVVQPFPQGGATLTVAGGQWTAGIDLSLEPEDLDALEEMIAEASGTADGAPAVVSSQTVYVAGLAVTTSVVRIDEGMA